MRGALNERDMRAWQSPLGGSGAAHGRPAISGCDLDRIHDGLELGRLSGCLARQLRQVDHVPGAVDVDDTELLALARGQVVCRPERELPQPVVATLEVAAGEAGRC